MRPYTRQSLLGLIAGCLIGAAIATLEAVPPWVTFLLLLGGMLILRYLPL